MQGICGCPAETPAIWRAAPEDARPLHEIPFRARGQEFATARAGACWRFYQGSPFWSESNASAFRFAILSSVGLCMLAQYFLARPSAIFDCFLVDVELAALRAQPLQGFAAIDFAARFFLHRFLLHSQAFASNSARAVEQRRLGGIRKSGRLWLPSADRWDGKAAAVSAPFACPRLVGRGDGL